MPCKTPRAYYPKRVPSGMSWSHSTYYTFPIRDIQDSTEVRLPYSRSIFWVALRILSFTSEGVISTTPLPIRMILRTTDGEEHTLMENVYARPTEWVSTRWALPSIRLPEEYGIFLQVNTGGAGGEGAGEGGAGGAGGAGAGEGAGVRIRIELQGFHQAYPRSRNYVLLCDNGFPLYLFQHEEDFCVDGISPLGSLHSVQQNDPPPTGGLNPQEIDGVALNPLSVLQDDTLEA